MIAESVTERNQQFCQNLPKNSPATGEPNGIADICVIFSRVDAENVPTLAGDSHQQYLEFFVPAPVDFYQQ
jgi:hypothetical protein